MRDLYIPVKRQKTELKYIIACFCAALLMNIVAIIIYKTSWSEIFTQLLWVLIIACALYVVSVILRVLYYIIKRLF